MKPDWIEWHRHQHRKRYPYLTPTSVMSWQPIKLRTLSCLLYLARVNSRLSVTCLSPSKLNIFRLRNFLMKIIKQLSDIRKQWDKSTSSRLHWWRASASIAPVVSHEQRANFNMCKLLQYKMTGCKHLGDKLVQWLRFKLTKPRFSSSKGINSESVMVQRLRFNSVSIVQEVVKTWK